MFIARRGLFHARSKILAYGITGSAAILSDAAESVVHIVAVSFAAYSLWLSHKPPGRAEVLTHLETLEDHGQVHSHSHFERLPEGEG